jgi:hypothetical protein
MVTLTLPGITLPDPKRRKPKPTQTPAERAVERRDEKKRIAAEKERRREFLNRPPATASETIFRHSNWQYKRALVLAAMYRAGASPTQVDAFQNCGSGAIVEWCQETQQYRIRATYCKNRNCEPCARAKANLMAANLQEKLKDRKEHEYRFITITLAHSDDPLRDQVNRLISSFRSLRATKMWKSHQAGGAYIIEIKWNPDTAEWHPHLHLIAQGDYLNQARLSEAWRQITTDSFVVDIKTLSSDKDAAHYVTKYVGKGTNLECWQNDAAAEEWITAMRGIRTMGTYGSWRGYKLLAKPRDEHAWKYVGSINGLYYNAAHGDASALRILEHLVEYKQYNPNRKRGKKPGTSPPDRT